MYQISVNRELLEKLRMQMNWQLEAAGYDCLSVTAAIQQMDDDDASLEIERRKEKEADFDLSL